MAQSDQITKRMPLIAEARWALATTLLGWSHRLTGHEASAEMAEAFGRLVAEFRNDPSHDTVWMKRRST